MKSILANKLGKYQTTFNSAVDTLTKLGALSHSTDPTQLVEAVDEIVRKYIILILNHLIYLNQYYIQKIYFVHLTSKYPYFSQFNYHLDGIKESIYSEI